MQNNKWTPIKEMEDDEKVYAGMRVRIYNVGLNVVRKEDDYYDYLISYIFGNEQYLQLVCLSEGEAGNILCVLERVVPDYHVVGKVLKHMVGLEGTYFLTE